MNILVVDDDEVVLRLLGTALPQYGLDVRLAGGGLEAVEVCQDHGQRFDLVLLELHMNGVDGPSTLALLRGVAPEVRCCFMTCFPDENSQNALMALGALGVLRKPFDDQAELAELLRRLARSHS
jgi:CheY-like chemotaxis protein